MKLEKCVWCGGKAVISQDFKNNPEWMTWKAKCGRCEWELAGFDSYDECEKEWDGLKDTADSRHFKTA